MDPIIQSTHQPDNQKRKLMVVPFREYMIYYVLQKLHQGKKKKMSGTEPAA